MFGGILGQYGLGRFELAGPPEVNANEVLAEITSNALGTVTVGTLSAFNANISSQALGSVTVGQILAFNLGISSEALGSVNVNGILDAQVDINSQALGSVSISAVGDVTVDIESVALGSVSIVGELLQPLEVSDLRLRTERPIEGGRLRADQQVTPRRRMERTSEHRFRP